MKHFFQVWSAWWFATMVPIYTPLTTIVARENMRKRRVQSIILLLAFIITLLMVVIYSFSMAGPLVLFCVAEDGCILCALRLNQRGHMELASLIFFSSEVFLILLTTDTMSFSDPHFMTWTFSPIVLLLAAAGIFLPPWIVFLMALSENLLLFWYLLVVRSDQLLQMSSQEIMNILIFLCVSIYVSAGIGAFYAILTRKAVMQADRAVELEQTHHSLTDAYMRLEKVHSDLEMAHVMISEASVNRCIDRSAQPSRHCGAVREGAGSCSTV